MLLRSRARRISAPLVMGALGALLLAGTARAQVLVTPTVTSTGSLFNYSYSVTNLTATDLLVVNLNGLPMVDGAITNLTAPTGFIFAPYDPGVGIASFLADSATFGPGSTVGGFSFTSAFAPSTITFDTLDLNGEMTTGTTLAPTAAPVPEASTLVSLGAGLLLLTAFTAVRRRRMAAARS